MLLEPHDCLFYKCDLHQLITSLKKKKTLLKENEQISRTWLAGSLTLVDTEKAACARRAFPTPPLHTACFPIFSSHLKKPLPSMEHYLRTSHPLGNTPTSSG